ncbi:MAG: tol-pal system YbgF family protein, partial [Planctomycetota bacterium]
KVIYDAESVPHLKKQLLARREDPIDLYVANRLLRPMLMAEAEVIQEIVPTALLIQSRARFKPFVEFPREKLGRKKLPVHREEVPEEQFLEELAELERGQHRKREMDLAVAKHDTQAAILKVTAAKLLIYANSLPHDTRALDMLKAEERAGRATFLTILEEISAEASRMDQKRARGYYDYLKRFGLSLRAAVKNYTDYTKPVILAEANSYFQKAPAEKNYCPGITVMETVNIFAPVANLPAVKVPTKAEIISQAMLNRARELLRTREVKKRNQAKNQLAQLIKKYPGSPAAKEAKEMLETLGKN